ncbi:hypothetical protein U1Q18_050402 [Sarracenia purpurea var. burkii]
MVEDLKKKLPKRTVDKAEGLGKEISERVINGVMEVLLHVRRPLEKELCKITEVDGLKINLKIMKELPESEKQKLRNTMMAKSNNFGTFAFGI